MGEPTCLMQPFSYASSAFPTNDSNEGNPIHALGQSVSFGRFTSESLSWERWSTFSHKRYVEEAERYTRPGSVAEKKAFFEAHYKKMAAKKAAEAALLEKAEKNNSPEKEPGDGVEINATCDPQTLNSTHQVSVSKPRRAEDFTLGGSSADADGCASKVESKDTADPVAENQLPATESLEVESTSQIENNINHQKLIEELKMCLDEKPFLKQTHNSDEEALGCTSKKMAESSSSKSAIRGKGFPSTPVKPTTPGRRRKENNAATINKLSAFDSSDKKKLAPKSLYKTITSTPAREFNRLTSTIIRKIDGSRAGPSKAPKDCTTPIKTPMASRSGVQMHPSATPKTESRGGRTPLDASASKSKSIGQRWRFLSAEKKTQSPLLSTPFKLRTEERATRRKQKLEEKFNANEVEKVQLQTKLKKKAESELQRLSFCFRARPLPDFYKERGLPKNEDDSNRVPLMHSQTPKARKKPSPSTVDRKPSHLPQRSQIKGGASKLNQEKNCKKTVWPSTFKSMKITRENTSPNIQ